MAQFGISNPLFLDSDEAETNVRRGLATNDFMADPKIDVGSPPALTNLGLRRPGQSRAPAPQSRYEIVFDQPNTERPAPTPPSMLGGKFSGQSKYEIVFDDVPKEEPVAPAAPKDDGPDTVRGFTTALGQTPALLKGAVGFAGAAGEKAFGEGGMFSSLKKYGLEGYQKDMAAIDKTAKDTDDVTVAWKKAKGGDLGALVDWAQYGVGYLGGNILETGATAVLGSLAGTVAAGPGGTIAGAATGMVGKEVVKETAKSLIESMVAKEAAKLAEKAGAKTITDDIAKQATRNVAKGLGSATALAGSSIIKETGSIYGEAEEQAAKEGRQLDAGDLSRIFGAGLVAGLSEAAVDKLGLDAATGKIRIPGGGRAGRALVGGSIGVGVEGGQELFQTAVERFGAAKNLTGEDAVREYINAFALGGLGGGIVGGLSGAVRGENAPSQTGTPAADSSGSVPPGGPTPGQTPPAAPSPDLQAPEATERDEQVAEFRRISGDQIRSTFSEPNGVAYIAALHQSSDPETQNILRKTMERIGNLAAFDAALANPETIAKGQDFIAKFPEFENDFLPSAREFALNKPTSTRVKAMPIIQQQEGTTDGSQTNASTPSGQPGGSVGSDPVLGQQGAGQAQAAVPQATQPAGTVDTGKLRLSRTAAQPDPRAKDVSDRLQKLTLDYQDQISQAKRIEMENKLSAGQVDEVEKFITDTYASFDKPSKADINGAKRQREFLTKVAERFALSTDLAEVNTLLSGQPTKNNVDRAVELMQEQAKKQVQALIKAKKPKSAAEVFRRTGLQEKNIIANREGASDVGAVFEAASRDAEREFNEADREASAEDEFDVEAPQPKILKRKTVAPAKFRFASNYVFDDDFQRVVDLIVASMARGEVSKYSDPKTALSNSKEAQQFLESLPEKKREQIAGRVKEDGETTKGWLGNTLASDLRSVLQEQEDQGRNFLREEDRLTPEEREVAVKIRGFEAEIYRILNMVNEAATYRDAIARLRAEQDAIYAALNGSRNLFFKNERGQIQMYESAAPQAEAGFIVSQFESPKNADPDEVVKDLNGLTTAGPMQSVAPERMVDMKDMTERSQEALRSRAAAITQEIRGLQEKSIREQAKLFRQGLLEIKTRLHNARTMAVRGGLPVSETIEPYENALKSIAALESDKPTVEAQQAIEAFEATEPTVVRDLAAEARESKLKEAWKAAIAELRSGNMTLGDLVSQVRAEGVSVPQEFMSIASELAMRTPLSRHLRQNNTGWTHRSQWAASLSRAAQKAKNFGLSDDLVSELNLTDGEKFTYFGWLKDRTKVASRDPVKGVNTVEEAFGNFLFAKYSLDQMRDPSLIENERDRAVLESVFGTPDAMVEAWFEDVYAAQKFDAPMARAAMAPGRIDVSGFANVAKEPMISPADAREYQGWRQRKLKAKVERAQVLARSAFSKALSNIQGLTDEQYDKYKLELATAQLNEKEAIIRLAVEAAKSNEVGSPLDKLQSEILDQTAVVDSLFAKTPEEIADDIRAATYDAVAEERVRTRKDFIGQELSGEGVSGVIFNDDGDYDYSADDARLARGKHSGVLTNAIVKRKVAQILSTWKLAPNIETNYANANMLPEPLRSAIIEKLGPNWNAKGLYNGEDGTVYLFSDFLLSEGDVEFTLFHETYGHLGLRAFLGSSFDTFLNTAYRTNQRVKALADQNMAEGLPRLEAIDEALADIAGENTPVAGFKALVGRLIAALRDAGFERVADWLATLTDSEVAWTLKMARETARSGGHKLIEGSPGELRLADERMPYELFSFRNNKTSAYARYNPLTMEWLVFTATGDDIRTSYTSRSMQDYQQVFDLMGKWGKVERRLRSGLYIDDKLPTDLVKVPDFRDVGKVRGLIRTLTQKLQNEYLPVWQYVEALAKQGKIDDRIDVKKALTLYERKTGVLIEDFNKQYVTPIMDALDRAKKLGATNEDLNNWLIARHAEERNRQVKKINAKNEFGSGMPPNTRRMPDGRVQEGYNQILARVKAADYSSAFEEIAKLTDIMGVEKVKYEVANGLIGTKDGLARLFAYKRYVNLSGVNSELDETPDLTEMVGTKFNVKGKDKRAMGRVDLAPDVLARTIQAYESSLIRGQKNKVAQTVLALMETNYDPDFVVINEQSYRRQVNKDTGLTDYILDANYIQRDDVMVAKVNGIPVTMRFKQTGAGSFAEAIHGVVYPKQSGPIMEAVGRYTQFIGQLVTTYNPAWIFVNFTRDVQTMYFNAAADKKITKQMAAQMVKNLAGSVRLAAWVASEKSPKLRKLIGQPRPDLLASYEEMRKEGGLTSFINRKGLEDQVHAIEVALTGNKTPIDRVKALLEFMEVLTLPMEMAPRLAAYHVTRKHGFTKADAAVFSGDITVNFNMRGQSKEIRQLYLFFNPAIQGTNKMYRLAKDDPKTFAKIVGAWIGFGAAMGMLGRALNDDDEEEINKYDKIPTYKRATSIVLKADMPGGSIPIPYGWNAFYALGNFMMDSVMGIQPVTTSAKRAAIAAFESFSPVGGSALNASSLDKAVLKSAPTALLPIIEYALNENRFGAPIYKDDGMFGAGAKTPDSYMAFDSVSPISKYLAQGLNTLTGGSRLKEGMIDINPAAVDFAIGAVLPGLVAETYKTASVAVKAASGEDTKPLPTPIIGRFEARVPEGYDAGAFRRAKELVDTKFKELEFTKDPKVRQEILKEYPGIGAAKGILASTTQEIRRMRSDLAEIENLSNLPDSRKIEIKNQIKKREKDLYSRAVKAVMNVGTEENKPFRDVLLAND